MCVAMRERESFTRGSPKLAFTLTFPWKWLLERKSLKVVILFPLKHKHEIAPDLDNLLNLVVPPIPMFFLDYLCILLHFVLSNYLFFVCLTLVLS